jgi:Zn-dependent protease with chaperone function
MAELSFDFQKYIDQRKGADEALAQSGEAYFYPGDQKVLRALARVTPVTLAVEATARLWRSRGGREMLSGAVKVGERQRPDLHRTALQCAERLSMALPALYVVPGLVGGQHLAYTLGTSEDAAIVLGAPLVDNLDPDELRFVVGHECGQVQSGHVGTMTALYYLTTSAGHYLRWIVGPAVKALRSWARRAEISCDRAGLLCCRELTPSIAALLRLELGTLELEAWLEPARYAEREGEEGASASGALAALQRQHPAMRARAAALRLFAETHYYLKESGRKPREDEGKSLAWCDERVKELLSRLPKEDRTGREG